MNPTPFQPSAPPSWFPMLSPDPPMSSFFWQTANVRDRLKDLQDTLTLAKAMQKELEMLMLMKDSKGSVEDTDNGCNDASVSGFSKLLEDRGINVESQTSLSVEAANCLMSKLRFQLEPFRAVTDEMCQWEEKSVVVRLANKIQKSKRNKLWRKRKRKRIAEMRAMERAKYDQADQEADEWRAREIANDLAKRKMEKMKEIAKLKAKEERNKLESELELVLIVEKLQELRSIRIHKLKKQGHFLPEEDDKFLERVQAAVEEEERQAIAAVDTDYAKDAIATAEESRKTTYNLVPDSEDLSTDRAIIAENNVQDTPSKNDGDPSAPVEKESGKQGLETQVHSGAYDSVANLPIEFYHYYHGSNNDMGTLIEVRRTWDAYIRPGGSCIPGHWVEPPPPANEIWASYLVRPK
ncbi:U11/U12 small nuclear ribonucleoprotein 59 kDa protein isoform X1 [Morus notabilis]|uniref:U11/U12 small nuclear ribonucleoprotein 59 kDa protein isoform X1 n=2 Tax=Morus notabilis TaxID=981085 RepID=UPI000CED0B6F|nr:U11/U12 small nuclear ribonucleoprotein 59 kDa protein isoform X1 [Morus notabilis]XP_024019034.1 U11/U12 small nuclear ribonucleoprotein 59 kDa protein isoform X1 [Morus notabilis]XP_024019035.1 U11/U12 small nuclear ribonucleoprotein 59 kDa protein isoform X1 [Morus notabilis]XP_024019036.1 U11/U12 small nuclear ribonucleoprotein 59 kDa protein isoform X1 [Morus notabilis]